MIEVLKIDEWLKKQDEEELKHFQDRLIAALMPLTQRKVNPITIETAIDYTTELFKELYGKK
jgi:hypothetical protein